MNRANSALDRARALLKGADKRRVKKVPSVISEDILSDSEVESEFAAADGSDDDLSVYLNALAIKKNAEHVTNQMYSKKTSQYLKPKTNVQSEDSSNVNQKSADKTPLEPPVVLKYTSTFENETLISEKEFGRDITPRLNISEISEIQQPKSVTASKPEEISFESKQTISEISDFAGKQPDRAEVKNALQENEESNYSFESFDEEPLDASKSMSWKDLKTLSKVDLIDELPIETFNIETAATIKNEIIDVSGKENEILSVNNKEKISEIEDSYIEEDFENSSFDTNSSHRKFSDLLTIEDLNYESLKQETKISTETVKTSPSISNRPSSRLDNKFHAKDSGFQELNVSFTASNKNQETFGNIENKVGGKLGHENIPSKSTPELHFKYDSDTHSSIKQQPIKKSERYRDAVHKKSESDYTSSVAQSESSKSHKSSKHKKSKKTKHSCCYYSHACPRESQMFNHPIFQQSQNHNMPINTLGIPNAIGNWTIDSVVAKNLELVQQIVALNSVLLRNDFYNATSLRRKGRGKRKEANKSSENFYFFMSKDVNQEELKTCIKVLQQFHDFPNLKALANSSENVRVLLDIGRRVFQPTAEEVRIRKKEKHKEKLEKDHQSLEVCGIRKMRKVKMVGMAGGSVALAQPPRVGSIEANLDFIAQDDKIANSFFAGQNEFSHVEGLDGYEIPPPQKLHFQRSCHICGQLFIDLHSFYDQLCLSCANFNYSKRFQKADMTGRVCLVTGARVKIGYAIALKFLRMSAEHVIVTTRFPHDAAKRFALEPDSHSFKNRLTVYGIDFRDVRMIHEFTNHVRKSFKRLDVIINNAAQTVRKPPAFYEHLMQGEDFEAINPSILEFVNVVDVLRVNNNYIFGSPPEISKLITNYRTDLIETSTPSQDTMVFRNPTEFSVGESSSMSQICLIKSDTVDRTLFPSGQLDRDDQQLDLRNENSWTLEMGQISTGEMMECHVINCFAPWILISELKSLMSETQGDKFIVNVSAMEGQFYRNKTIFHPHTNMAKASLNMMTRTAAAGFADINIFMTAVDTGWITDEQPQHTWEKRSIQPPPLDEWDAAMRVLDPVLSGIRGEERLWGVFLKNYRPTRW